MRSAETKHRAAAQYLRVSTDSQRYSLEHQAASIAAYAAVEGFTISKSYVDAGKSGVTANKRLGLAELLADITRGEITYSTLLVLDVSRWGRYQDPDEAAHYEFLCRSAGVDVCYCAESFEPGLAGSVFKHIKRVMAGEYSRELSAKIRNAKRRHALAGHAQGGACKYGFARQIVNVDGTLGKILERYERKSRPEQSLILVPEGPKQSATLRKIFRLYLKQQLQPVRISERLNSEGIGWCDGTPWTRARVVDVLRCDLVTGRQPFGKTSCHLGKSRIYNPKDTWGMVRIFPPIVSMKTFNAAQARLAELNGSRKKTDAELLDDLRKVHKLHGRITNELLEATPGTASLQVYYARFGTMVRAYQRIGLHYTPRERGRDANGQRLSREEVLEALRRLYREHGKINMSLCHADHRLPALGWLRWEFGSIAEAFEAAGLPHFDGGPVTKRKERLRAGFEPTRDEQGVMTGPFGGRYKITADGRRRYGYGSTK